MAAPVRRELAPLPDLRCPLAQAGRASHEWAPRPSGGFYCTACLDNISVSDVDDWKLLLEIESQRGETALSGEAYHVLLTIAADSVSLSAVTAVSDARLPPGSPPAPSATISTAACGP